METIGRLQTGPIRHRLRRICFHGCGKPLARSSLRSATPPSRLGGERITFEEETTVARKNMCVDIYIYVEASIFTNKQAYMHQYVDKPVHRHVYIKACSLSLSSLSPHRYLFWRVHDKKCICLW